MEGGGGGGRKGEGWGDNNQVYNVCFRRRQIRSRDPSTVRLYHAQLANRIFDESPDLPADLYLLLFFFFIVTKLKRITTKKRRGRMLGGGGGRERTIWKGKKTRDVR